MAAAAGEGSGVDRATWEAAVSAVVAGRSVMVTGAAGIGKTAFLQALLSRAPHRRIARAMPGDERDVLLTADGDTLPIVGTPAPGGRAPLRSDDGTPLLVAADDAQLLRANSVMHLGELVDAHEIQLLLTRRIQPRALSRDASTLTALTQLWVSGITEMIDLGPLPLQASTRMLRQLVAPRTVGDRWGEMVHRLSGGVPGVLRAVVADLAQRGDLDRAAPLVPGPLRYVPSWSTTQLVRGMLDALTAENLSHLAVIARIGEIDAARLAALIGSPALITLIEDGAAHLIAATQTVRVGEAFGSVAASMVSSDQTARVEENVADRIVADAAAGLEWTDAEALLVSDDWTAHRQRRRLPAAAELLLHACRVSALEGSPEQALRLAALLHEEGVHIDVDTAVAVADAHAEMHQHDTARRVLLELEPPADAGAARSLLLAHRRLAVKHTFDLEEFRTVLMRAHGWFAEPVWQRVLAAEWRSLRLLVEHQPWAAAPAASPAETAIAEPALPGGVAAHAAEPQAAEADRATALRAHRAVMLTVGGELPQAFLALNGADRPPARAGTRVGGPARSPTHPDASALADVTASPDAADLTATIELYVQQLVFRIVLGLDEGTSRSALHELFSIPRFRAHISRSGVSPRRVETFAAAIDQTAALGATLHPGTPEDERAWTILRFAQMCVMIGRFADAGHALAQTSESLRTISAWYRSSVERTSAELDLAVGERDRARERALAAATQARDSAPLPAALLFDIALRAGAPTEPLAQATARLARTHGDRLIHTVAVEARAHAQGDTQAKAEATRSLLAMGAHPRLAVVPAHAVISSELSIRENQIAGMVARGMGNKQVADALHLSVRTVESHLHHARVKLGLSGREWLQQLLEDQAHSLG